MSGLALLLLLLPAAAHPMHTAVTQIGYDVGTQTADIQIRVFADDLAAAAGELGTAPDSAIQRYLTDKFSLLDRGASPVPLRWLGVERSGDVVLIRLAATVPGGLSGAQIVSTILCERFADQVNVVRVSSGRATSTLLFTRGDGAKAIS